MWLTKKIRCRDVFRFVAGLFLFFAQSLHLSLATEQCIAVYYPDVGKPYDTVFKQILSGIDQEVDVPIDHYLVNQTEQNPAKELFENKNDCGAIIGLGRSGLKVVLEAKVPAIVGAVIAQPDEITTLSGVSLIPQPKEIFDRLVHFMPSIQSVFVVYSPENNSYVISEAIRVAKQMNIKLQAIEASDLKSAFAKYKNIMETMDANKSALWFLHDPETVDSRTILPFVLKLAWDRKLFIFSNQAGHAKNGVLFSVYPDNVRLGKRLGKFAEDCIKSGCSTKKFTLLNDLLTAVNIRTANRLGIRLNTRRDPFINIIFPQR